MPRTLRHLVRLPHLRVMAWLAWLMLAMAPVHAAPGGMPDMAPAAGHAAHQAHMSDGMHHAMPVKSECCDGQDHADHGTMNTCHCAATCSTVLPVMAMTLLSAVAPAVLHVASLRVIAPKLAHAPPLRPPLVRISELT
ncbi:hypothetical protein [Rhodanobacter sp. C01]|uniref:hypothetical protein n=1 Tax=Rhodanobacter sp. C01 TaxID=1945856 RepID=UPI00098576B3|nr:hypothetical protein [Rhodanobacter sp. C01]